MHEAKLKWQSPVGIWEAQERVWSACSPCAASSCRDDDVLWFYVEITAKKGNKISPFWLKKEQWC